MKNSDNHNDPQELARGQEFIHLYVGNERCIYAYIYTLLYDWMATEDVLQEAAKVMWIKFHEFEPGTDFLAWALCIAHYQVLKYRKSQSTKKMVFNSQLIEDLARYAETYAHEDTREQEALRNCLSKLSERDRELLELRYEINTSVRTVAQRVGRGVNAIYKALNRIHTQLYHCILNTLALEE